MLDLDLLESIHHFKFEVDNKKWMEGMLRRSTRKAPQHEVRIEFLREDKNCYIVKI